MDPIASLAARVVAVLVPYLAKTGEEFAKEMGKAAATKIGELYQALKTRFKNKPAAKKALAGLKAKPTSKRAQAALQSQLGNQMSADRTLADQLEQLLSEIRQKPKTYSFHTEIHGGSVDEIIDVGELKGGIIINKLSGKK